MVVTLQTEPEIRSQLVHMLYSAMPQVVSSTLGCVFLATTIWWQVPSAWTLAVIAAAVIVAIVRLTSLVAYRRRNGDLPAIPAQAVVWERIYGAFSMTMALVIAAALLSAFLLAEGGVLLVATGVALGICGGQSTARVTCRPWIPLASGTIILGTLTLCALLWDDPIAPVLAAFAVLYLYTYVEACRHSARTILGRLMAEHELAKLVRRDVLTGLANRRGFEEELDRALYLLQRTGRGVSLLLLDLDGFKTVNDAFGHPCGDAVLREVADRLVALSRRSDHVARLGGDEFAIVVTDAHDRGTLAVYARRLIAGLTEPIRLPDGEARIGVSIGIGMADAEHPRTAAELFAATDAALYKVKKGTKNDLAVVDWPPASAGHSDPGSSVPAELKLASSG